MSRAPPFPTRRRSPSVTNGNPYPNQQPSSAPGASAVRPLQITRNGSRPTTPVNSYVSSSPTSYTTPNTAPLGPSRPQRSELRARADYQGSERASTSSQDPYTESSSNISRFDVNGARNVPYSANNALPGSSPRQQSQRLTSPSLNTDDPETTPTSLSNVLSAFQSAGSKRRQTVEDDDYYYQRQRELEIEAEKARQLRLKERTPGIRSKSGRGGEIDGMESFNI